MYIIYKVYLIVVQNCTCKAILISVKLHIRNIFFITVLKYVYKCVFGFLDILGVTDPKQKIPKCHITKYMKHIYDVENYSFI